MKLVQCSIICVGYNHDSLPSHTRELTAKMVYGFLPRPHYLVGDEAYAWSDCMLTPISPTRAHPRSSKDAFNGSHKSAKTHGLLLIIFTRNSSTLVKHESNRSTSHRCNRFLTHLLVCSQLISSFNREFTRDRFEYKRYKVVHLFHSTLEIRFTTVQSISFTSRIIQGCAKLLGSLCTEADHRWKTKLNCTCDYV